MKNQVGTADRIQYTFPREKRTALSKLRGHVLDAEMRKPFAGSQIFQGNTQEFPEKEQQSITDARNVTTLGAQVSNRFFGKKL